MYKQYKSAFITMSLFLISSASTVKTSQDSLSGTVNEIDLRQGLFVQKQKEFFTQRSLEGSKRFPPDREFSTFEGNNRGYGKPVVVYYFDTRKEAEVPLAGTKEFKQGAACTYMGQGPGGNFICTPAILASFEKSEYVQTRGTLWVKLTEFAGIKLFGWQLTEDVYVFANLTKSDEVNEVLAGTKKSCSLEYSKRLVRNSYCLFSKARDENRIYGGGLTELGTGLMLTALAGIYVCGLWLTRKLI